MPSKIRYHRKITEGQVIGKFTVLHKSNNKTSSGAFYWTCRCECGNVLDVNPYCLRHNPCTNGCGKCLAYNKYDMESFDFGVVYVGDTPVLFDKEDYPIIRPFTWVLRKGRCVTTTKDGNIQMSRLVIGASDANLYVDHSNHIKLDNRKKNLRVCTPSQNEMNKKRIGYWKRKNKDGTARYYVRARVNGKTKTIAVCRSKEEAATEWEKYILKEYGEFAYNEELVKNGIENYERVLRLAEHQKQVQGN